MPPGPERDHAREAGAGRAHPAQLVPLIVAHADGADGLERDGEAVPGERAEPLEPAEQDTEVVAFDQEPRHYVRTSGLYLIR